MEITLKNPLFSFAISEVVDSHKVSATVVVDAATKKIVEISGGVIADSEGVELANFNCSSNLRYNMSSTAANNSIAAELIQQLEVAILAQIEVLNF